MGIVAVGSIGFDTIKTPFGSVEDIVGGSLTYFSLSASHFTDVSMVAVVGQDFTDEHLQLFAANPRIDTTGLQRVEGNTFRWGCEYSFNLNQRETLFTELNVFEGFQPVLPESYRKADIVFLGNMHPALQFNVLDQVQEKRIVGMDSMNLWIDITPNELRDVLKRVDILKIDDSEARQLADEYNLRRAAVKIMGMGPKMLIATRGSNGAMMFTQDGIFSAPAYPLEDEVDPTGAGDSFAGGFFGYLAQHPAMDDATLRRAMIFGSAMGSMDVEDFGTGRVSSVSNDEITDRYRKIKLLTHFEDAD